LQLQSNSLSTALPDTTAASITPGTGEDDQAGKLMMSAAKILNKMFVRFGSLADKQC
jgi:hypothetical protein